MNRPRFTLFSLACGLALCLSANAQNVEGTRPAIAIDSVDGIVEALRSHRVVAITEGVGHGHEQGHAFLTALINDPRLSDVVDDIVVEWGNSLYQGIIDRYTNGGDVPYSDLRQAWENTTQPHPVWDASVFRVFFDTVRSRNDKLPAGKRFRVLLGDPPVDWQAVVNPRDLASFSRERDAYPAELIRSEVVDKDRRALVIYGGLHLIRLPKQRDEVATDSPDLQYISQSLVMRLEHMGIEVFNSFGIPLDAAAEIQPSVSNWNPVRMTLIEGTTLGAAGFQEYFPSMDGTPMEDQFDALMIFGPRSEGTFSEIPAELCDDEEYVVMRSGRLGIDDPQTFSRRYCGR